MDIFANFGDALFWFLVLLTPLVFVHELGHYAVARWCGVRVDVFSIGFGPELFGWNARSGTRWKVCAVPLGGYIKMFGEHVLEANDEGEIRELTEDEKKVSFDQKTLGQRAAIVAAGPGANYVFAVILLAFLYVVYGQSYTPPTIVALKPDSAAARAGLVPGDNVLSINGSKINRFEDLRNYVGLRPGEKIRLEVDRDGSIMELTTEIDSVDQKMIDGTIQKVGSIGVGLMAPVVAEVMSDSAAEAAGFRSGDRILRVADTEIGRFEELREIVMAAPGEMLELTISREGRELILPVTPKEKKIEGEDGQVVVIGLLGVTATPPPTAVVKFGLVRAIGSAVERSAEITTNTLMGLGQIITGKRDSKELGGPIMIAQVSGKVAKLGLAAFISMMAIFSVTLGLINLFPVPVLDGGHLVLYGVEALRGRPLSDRAQEFSFKIGLALVASLMIFVFMNDVIYRL